MDSTNVPNKAMVSNVSFVSSNIPIPGLKCHPIFGHFFFSCFKNRFINSFSSAYEDSTLNILNEKLLIARRRRSSFNNLDQGRPTFSLDDGPLGALDKDTLDGFQIIGSWLPRRPTRAVGNLISFMGDSYRASGQLSATQLLTTISTANGIITTTTNALKFVDHTYSLIAERQQVVARIRLHERPSLYVGCYLCTVLATMSAIIRIARRNQLNDQNS